MEDQIQTRTFFYYRACKGCFIMTRGLPDRNKNKVRGVGQKRR